MTAAPDRASPPPYTLGEMVRYVLGLGTWGFGGPVALVGYMHRDLVERRGWLTEEDFKQGLTLAQIAPGPLAAQVAIYLGYCRYGVLGATLVGVAFVLPSFLMVVGLGWLYVRYGGLAWMQAVFYGVGAAIIGIIARSALQLTKKAIGTDRLRWAIYVSIAVATFLTEYEPVGLVVLAGILAWAVRTPPAFVRVPEAARASVAYALLAAAAAWTVFDLGIGGGRGAAGPAVSAAGGENVLGTIAWYFGKAGAFVFGSGLAIVPFLYGGVVREFGWLDERQFVDAVAVAMITPGPVVITVGFIGYLVAGLAGACVAALATFLPCYLFTVIPAPYLRRHGAAPAVRAAVDGVTAAATGAIAGAVVVLGRRSVVDVPTALLAAGAYAAVSRGKAPEPIVVIAAAIVGILLRSGG